MPDELEEETLVTIPAIYLRGIYNGGLPRVSGVVFSIAGIQALCIVVVKIESLIYIDEDIKLLKPFFGTR